MASTCCLSGCHFSACCQCRLISWAVALRQYTQISYKFCALCSLNGILTGVSWITVEWRQIFQAEETRPVEEHTRIPAPWIPLIIYIHFGRTWYRRSGSSSSLSEKSLLNSVVRRQRVVCPAVIFHFFDGVSSFGCAISSNLSRSLIASRSFSESLTRHHLRQDIKASFTASCGTAKKLAEVGKWPGQ
jgi:hypothetical protein